MVNGEGLQTSIGESIHDDAISSLDGLSLDKVKTSAIMLIDEGVTIADANDPALPLVYCNEAFAQLTGYSQEETVGRNCSFLQGPETDPATIKKLRRALRKKPFRRIRTIIKNYRKDGSAFWNELNISPVFDTEQNLRYFIGIQRNVTAQVETQEKLRKSKYELEVKQKQLLHKQKQLERLIIDLSELDYANAKLKQRILYDPLTNVANATLLEDRVNQAIERRKRHKDFNYAILFVDFDNFKAVNDQYGHQAGNEFLIGVGEILGDCIRLNDTVARLGGDEFVVLLENLDKPEEAELIAERIRHAFGQGLFIKGLKVHSTTSIGVVYEVEGYMSAKALLNDADSAMYKAKNLGKNRVVTFSPDDAPRNTLQEDLYKAIIANELEVYYQPIFGSSTRQVLAVEALARWIHPQLGEIAPSKFIPMAESSGLIIELDAYVLKKSCEQIGEWQKSLEAPLNLHVNFSGRHLMNNDISARTEMIIEETSFSASQLKLELTESVMLNINTQLHKTFEALKALGIEICIDDFGTGFSSLSHLQNVPSRLLKVPRQFIKNVHEAKQQQLLKAVVTLAHSLDMDVVAEGVETAEELSFVQDLGCRYVQGFYFSKALPAQELEGLLAAQA